MLARPCARRLLRRFRLPPKPPAGLWPRRGAIGPCTCCCCCKVCPGGGWCLPEYLYVRLQNLSFPACGPPTGCVCDDWAWLDGQTGRVRRVDVSSDPNAYIVPCRTWAAINCDSLGIDVGLCGTSGQGNDGLHTGAGRTYNGGCAVVGQVNMGCDCAVLLPTPAPVLGGEFGALVDAQCYQLGDGTSALGVEVVFAGVVSGADGGAVCCWHNPGIGAAYGIYVPGGTSVGTWAAGGVVCDATNHFVSQVFTFTLPGGVSGEILVYA